MENFGSGKRKDEGTVMAFALLQLLDVA